MTVSIVSPSAAAVKPRRHPRFRREDIPAPEIDPVLKAFGRHIARHCCKVSDEAAFCLIQRPYISKTLLTRRISPRGSP